MSVRGNLLVESERTTVRLQPSALRGVVQVPASKSVMQRACAAALLYTGETVLHNPGYCHDDKAALEVIQQLGAQVQKSGKALSLRSKGVHPISHRIHCGESGLGIRMFTPIAALSNQPIVLDGGGSLASRPLSFFDEVLPQVGVAITSNKGRLPLAIQGPLQPASISVDGALSSQFLTGLLFAYAAAGATGVSLVVRNLTSKPYIDITLQVLEHFGWRVEHRNYEEFFFWEHRGAQPLGTPLEYTVEGDWSSAALLLVGGAIAGSVTVAGVQMHSVQADKAILHALHACGAQLVVERDTVTARHAPLHAFHFNATDCPDLFPPLVALAAYCTGVSTLRGVHRLAHKESNRAVALQEEFGKMGVEITVKGDVMSIIGGASIRGARVHSHNDHRIAMACAIASTKADGDTFIDDAQAVNKSYPDFYTHVRQLGGYVESCVHKMDVI